MILVIFLSFYSGSIYDIILWIVYMAHISTPYSDWLTAWPYFATFFACLSFFNTLELFYVILIAIFEFFEIGYEHDAITTVILLQ